MGKIAKSIKDRILSSIQIDPNTECWEWNKSLDYTGYARMILPDKSKVLVHRASYVEFVGKIPLNMQVCHKCDNRKCCNPNHLFLGTAKDNAHDRDSKGRTARHFGTKNPNSKLTEQEVRNIKFLVNMGISRKSLSEIYNIGVRHVGDLVNGKRWGWVE